MSYWILTIAGRVISRTTVQRITNLELGTNEAKERCKEYNDRIKALLYDDNHVVHGVGERQLQDWDEYTGVKDEAFLTTNSTAQCQTKRLTMQMLTSPLTCLTILTLTKR